MSLHKLSAATAVVAFSMISFAAAAADVSVSCEKRTSRSSISVDGNNLAPGAYRAVVVSGAAAAVTPFEAADGDEAEFDFASNAGDIGQGATAVSPSFIVNGQVRAHIVNSANVRVTPIVTANCRIRR